MLYIANPCHDLVRRAMSEQRLGCITTPAQGNRVPDGAWWCADNGKFGNGWPGFDAWYSWLGRKADRVGRERMLFATAPDVVGDALATMQESLIWLGRVRRLDIPVAFVAQDGCTARTLTPWGQFDVLFLGGTDEFKLGPEGAAMCRQAHARGVPIHMGRVNSKKRIKYALDLGCRSVDGTYLAFGPVKNLGRLSRWYCELGLPHFNDWQENAA